MTDDQTQRILDALERIEAILSKLSEDRLNIPTQPLPRLPEAVGTLVDTTRINTPDPRWDPKCQGPGA